MLDKYIKLKEEELSYYLKAKDKEFIKRKYFEYI